MTAPNQRNTSVAALLWPLPESSILVPSEKVFYRERRHWSALAPYLVETFAVFVLLFVGFGGYPTNGGVFVAAIVLGSIAVIARLVQARTWRLSDGALLLLVVFFLLQISGGSSAALGMAIALAASGRMVAHYRRWGYYEIRYVTDRRIIETSGFFGTRISSMPIQRVTDISLTRSVFGEIFDYGTLRVESAGQDQALGRIPYLVYPDVFHEWLVLLSTRSHHNGQ